MTQLNNPDTGYLAKTYYNSDLAKIIPPIQYAYYYVNDDQGLANFTVIINGHLNTNKYYVLTSLVDQHGSSSSTYTAPELVQALGSVIIYNKHISNFSFYVNKTDGDITRLYLCFTIIYYQT